ncbi:hypothetical protein [Flavobacterium sp. LB3R33]|uniref:hypothetical protein n=1 Tax=Flavobacterium sp. LB3R33 TaxID=3401721 RepID=UPI003AB06966
MVTVACLQLIGLASTSQISYTTVYVPDGVFAANVKTPFASMLSGPVVIGVTSVLSAVTATPFKVSFAVTFPIVVIAAGTCTATG